MRRNGNMTVPKRYEKRLLVSFRGRCPMLCKHCYTYELPGRDEKTIPEIVLEAANQIFDVIYVSQKYENFYDEKQGLSLCQELYAIYQKDILIITRSYLSDAIINQLGTLNKKMQSNGNQLYMAVSLCADQSYAVTESQMICPAPSRRLENLRRGRLQGVKTVLLLRPIFPDVVIPVKECIGLLEQAKHFVDAVVSSGLIVTDTILTRLGLERDMFSYLETGDSEYLSDLENPQYLDVDRELALIQKGCKDRKIPFFRHSMPALNYLAETL